MSNTAKMLEISKIIGPELRRRRKDLDLKLRHIAELSGVSLGYISQIEKGRNRASLEALFKICTALETTVSEVTKVLDQAVEKQCPSAST